MHISEYVLHRHQLRLDRRQFALVLTGAAALLMAGCESAPWRSTVPNSTPAHTPASPATPAEAAQTGSLDDYINYARSVSVLSPELRVKRHQQALAEYRQHPEMHSKIRVALVASFLNPLPDAMEQTRALFKELLQPALAKPPGVAALLEIRLNELDRYLAMQKQAEQLQQELDAAQAKIQALTTIEQTLESPGSNSKGAR